MKRFLIVLAMTIVVLDTRHFGLTSEPPTTARDRIEFAPSQYEVDDIPVDRPVVLVPSVSVRKDTNMNVTFLWRNTSDKPFRYPGRRSNSGLSDPLAPSSPELSVLLYKDGKPVPLLSHGVYAGLTPTNVQILQPGEYAVCRVSLKDNYGVDGIRGNLPSGLYELRARYEVREGDSEHQLGCTPASMNRTIMLIDIVE